MIKKSGQGTIEYILLTALAAGVIIGIYSGPMQSFLSDFTGRKQAYTTVVSQQKLGIPLSWFGGKNGQLGGDGGYGIGPNSSSGSSSSGASSSGGTSSTTNANNGENPENNTNNNPNNKNNGKNNKPNAGPGGPATAPNSPGTLPGTTNPLDTRGVRRNGTTGDETANVEGGGGGTGGGSGGVNNPRANGLFGGGQNASAKGFGSDTKGHTTKEAGDDSDTDNVRDLYGAPKPRIAKGSCGNLDWSMLIKIGFLVALFFILASVLFQKRGDGE